MTDDIVTRLRNIGSLTCYYCQESCSDGDWEDCCSTYDDRDNCHDRNKAVSEAADEIERLRAFILEFPCTCWINKPKCTRCEVAGY